jgi:hypothetical protein
MVHPRDQKIDEIYAFVARGEACSEKWGSMQLSMPTAASGIRREHLETFIEDQLAHFRPSTAATRYRDLRQLFAGCWTRAK